MKIHLKAGLHAQRKHKQHAPIRRCSLSLLIVLIPISLRKLSANIKYDYFKIYQELCMPGTFVHCTQATLTSCRMGAVVLVPVAMTAVGPTAGVTRTAP